MFRWLVNKVQVSRHNDDRIETERAAMAATGEPTSKSLKLFQISFVFLVWDGFNKWIISDLLIFRSGDLINPP